MYELIRVGENSYYINCPAKMGLYRCAENRIFLPFGNLLIGKCAHRFSGTELLERCIHKNELP